MSIIILDEQYVAKLLILIDLFIIYYNAYLHNLFCGSIDFSFIMPKPDNLFLFSKFPKSYFAF